MLVLSCIYMLISWLTCVRSVFLCGVSLIEWNWSDCNYMDQRETTWIIRVCEI
jgi:hypothetical protein